MGGLGLGILMATVIEFCAGAGGQALGLEQAGFDHVAAIEIDQACCETLRKNRPGWNVLQADMKDFKSTDFKGVDLFAAGLPCPPFSIAGKQLGKDDERDLFPTALRIIGELQPNAILIENVKGILSPRFEDYRQSYKEKIEKLGYRFDWRLVNSSDFGVSQLRPRVIFFGLKKSIAPSLPWPCPHHEPPIPVGELLFDLIKLKGWKKASQWRANAAAIAPTIVGGSKKHGGPDLGPSRAREAWKALGVDGRSLANDAPEPDFEGCPKLTVRMVARIQGFPDSWHFCGSKTLSYKQVGNAVPPPVAKAFGLELKGILDERIITERMTG